jgi:hypothetical protein
MTDFTSNKYLEQDESKIDYNEIFCTCCHLEVYSENYSLGNILVNIIDPNNNINPVIINVNNTILDMKEIINQFLNYPVEKQRLIYKSKNKINGLSLYNNHTILNYPFLRDKVILYLVLLN